MTNRIADQLVVEEVVSHLGREQAEKGFGEQDVQAAYTRLRYLHGVSTWNLPRGRHPLPFKRVERILQATADHLAEVSS